jgi:hypothetical protein
MTTNSGTVCTNCRRPITAHRPWCSTFKTASETPRDGEMVDHPLLGPATVLSVYSRSEAFEDGTLVDCTQDFFDELNRNAGVVFDVAMTSAVFHRYVEVPTEFKGLQDQKGRYWDLLWMWRWAAKRHSHRSELLFEFISVPNGGDIWDNERPGEFAKHRIVQLKAVAGPGDYGEPCLTFMLPSED